MTIWRNVVGYEGYYEVSDDGQVRSIRNNHGNARCRPLRPQLTHDGYFRVELSRDNQQRKYKVHVLMLEAFVGVRPDGLVGCHNDGDSKNNQLSNLRWDTPRGNYDDLITHGSHKGTNHHAATIDEKVALAIKLTLAEQQLTARQVAAKHGVTINVVNNIKHGKTWAWLEA